MENCCQDFGPQIWPPFVWPSAPPSIYRTIKAPIMQSTPTESMAAVNISITILMQWVIDICHTRRPARATFATLAAVFIGATRRAAIGPTYGRSLHA